jgi:hypothetical protein
MNIERVKFGKCTTKKGVTYSDLYTIVKQYRTAFQRLFTGFGVSFFKILAWFWSNPYANTHSSFNPEQY